MREQMIYPLAFYVFYTFLLGVLNFRTRLGAIRSGSMSHKYFKIYSGDAPERVTVVGRHYDNQFQLPMLFFTGGALAIALGWVNITTLAFAWAFVLARLLHSGVHLGSNHVRKRALAFALGWFLVLCLWGQLVLFALGI